MKSKFKKIAPLFILSSLILVVGVFCGVSIASAQNRAMNMPTMIDSAHCANENNEVQKNGPISNALMPCCVERHDNSGTIVPTVTQERVKFSQSLMTEQIVCADYAIDQKIYPSSPSPPPEAENISSTVKIE